MDQNDRMFGHDRSMTAHYFELCKDLTDEQWDQEFDIGHRTLRNSFDHMNESVNFWTGCMIGVPNHREEGHRTPEQLAVEHLAVYDRFAVVARSVIADGRLDATFVDPWQVPRSFGATILHVVLHNQTHRTEILHILPRLGLENLPEGDPLEWERIAPNSQA